MSVIAGAIGFGVNLITIPLILRFAHSKGLYDDRDHRKLHDGSIPALGGVGIVFSFLVASVAGYLILQSQGEMRDLALWYDGAVIGGLIFMHVIGVVDDMVDIPAWRKLFLQLVAGMVIVSGGAAVHMLRFPMLGLEIPLGPWGFPLTVMWIVGIANAVNLIDGIDGFSGGVAVVAATVFGVLALTGGNAANAVLSFAFVGAVAGFLIFNLPPARIFMGDGGSLFAGSFLATLAITQAGPGGSSLILGIPIVLLTIPLLDTLAALFRRLRRRMPIHTPDREHFHHLLLDRAGSNRRALLVGYGLSALLGVSALVYAYAPPPSGVAFLVGGPAVVISVYVVLDRQTQRLRVRSLEQQLASHSARNGSAVDMTNGSEADIKTVKHHTVEDTHHRQ